MELIKNGIVFSNDIKKILKGSNALNYNYQNNGISIPSEDFISNLRSDFKNTVNTIFNGNTTIISEEEMSTSISSAIKDVFGVLPHRLARPNIS